MAKQRFRDPLADIDRGLRALMREPFKPLSSSENILKDLEQISRGLRITGSLVGTAEISATLGVQSMLQEGGVLRGASAVVFGGLKGTGLGGAIDGLLRAAAGPRAGAEFALRYTGVSEGLELWGGSVREVGVFVKKDESEELVEGERRSTYAKAQIGGRARVDLTVSDIGVRGRVESLGDILELKAFDVFREAIVRDKVEVMVREARSFTALRAQVENERSRIAAILGE